MRKIGFADKTDVLLVGPFLAGSRLLIERGGNYGCLLKFDHGAGSDPTLGSKELVFNLNDPWRFVGGITYAHPVSEVW